MDKQTVDGIIDKLLVIQERDSRIARCQKELADIPHLKQNIEAELSQQQAALDKSKETINTQLVAVKHKEVEIETIRQQIAKFREQQFQIKSNEEFKVLNREIAALQANIRVLEDSAIVLMETVERVQQERKGLNNDLAKAQEEVQAKFQQLDERRKHLEVEVGQLQSDRNQLAVAVPEDWLTRYNRVMENRKDIALVIVENNSCGGCHMTLPPHVLQDIKRGDSIITCSFCGRLLYWRA